MAKEFVCITCGYIGEWKEAKRVDKRNLLLEIILGIFSPVWPFWWRLGFYVCPQCTKASIVSTNSSVGKKYISELYQKKEGN